MAREQKVLVFYFFSSHDDDDELVLCSRVVIVEEVSTASLCLLAGLMMLGQWGRLEPFKYFFFGAGGRLAESVMATDVQEPRRSMLQE